ncbi:hypothetical protein HK105_204463 [Polyrhizophydium stewartii]|uniref:Cyclic nucleotide-binding domain-containing protein n=1 Tax=Polyrhizophydium stewartii TaxID=2732419 RepID=A0ABR4N9B9_9FUNG
MHNVIMPRPPPERTSSVDAAQMDPSSLRAHRTVVKKEIHTSSVDAKTAKELEQALNRTTTRFMSLRKAARLTMIVHDMSNTTKRNSSTEQQKESTAIVSRTIAHVSQGRHYKRWRLAVACTKMGIRLSTVYRDISLRTQAIRGVPMMETGALTYLLKTFKSQADSNLSQKICRLLDVHTERNKEIVETIERILNYRVRSFAQFSLTQRLRLSTIMQYERFPSETLVVKEGHVAWSFYFILSGQVEVFVIQAGMRRRVGGVLIEIFLEFLNILNAGDCFGAMQLVNDLRTACISTLMECEFLRIDKNDYLEITTSKDTKHLEEKLDALRRVPELERLAATANSFFELSTYEPNETILYEGTEATKISWILSGSCRCVKVVPFVQKTMQIGFEKAARQLRPYDGTTLCGPEEEVIHTTLTIQELDAWDHFPGLPAVEPATTEYTFNKDAYLRRLGSDLDASSVKLKAEYSVFTSSKVEIASISILDFVRLADAHTVLEVLSNKNQINVAISQLQEAYIEKRKWETFKKSVVNQVHSKK